MARRKPDAYLSETVRDLPWHFVFNLDGRLKSAVQRYVDQGVVRVIAGALSVHLVIQIKRPYFRPCLQLPNPDVADSTVVEGV